jgi:hypothetical protein
MFILSFVNITPFGMPISCRRRLKDPETPCLINHAHLYVLEDGLLELTLDLYNVRKCSKMVGISSRAYLLARVISA